MWQSGRLILSSFPRHHHKPCAPLPRISQTITDGPSLYIPTQSRSVPPKREATETQLIRVKISELQMCRSTDYPGFQAKREALKIQAFFLRFKGLDSRKPLPESLTLSYLPRINGTALEISGSKIRPDSPAFVTLHRAVNAKVKKGEAIYGSREAVRAGDGVRFEAYLREEKVLKGIFRKEEGQDWKLECKCVLESESVGAEITEAEVCVAVEGHVAMIERVAMVVKRPGKCGFHPLEEIPEVDDESDGVCCCVCGEMDGGDWDEDGDVEKEEEEELEEELEMDVEGVRWAVDVGFWVMCLGVGYLVSKASSKSLRRRRLF